MRYLGSAKLCGPQQVGTVRVRCMGRRVKKQRMADHVVVPSRVSNTAHKVRRKKTGARITRFGAARRAPKFGKNTRLSHGVRIALATDGIKNILL